MLGVSPRVCARPIDALMRVERRGSRVAAGHRRSRREAPLTRAVEHGPCRHRAGQGR